MVGGVDGSVNVYDAETGKFIFSIPRVGEIVAFAPDSNSVVSLDTNGNAMVLNLEIQRAAPIVTRLTRRDFDYGAAVPLAVTPDGHWLAAGGKTDNEISIWRLETGALRTILRGHTGVAPERRRTGRGLRDGHDDTSTAMACRARTG